MTEDTRGRIRANVDYFVNLKAEGLTATGLKTTNLSMNGVLVHTTEQIPLHTKVHLDLILDEATQLILHIDGEVARVTDESVAITFSKMDPDTYGHLKKTVRFNVEDPDTFEDESAKKPGFK